MRPCSEAGAPPLASREDLQTWKRAPGHERGLIIRWILLIILFDGPFFFLSMTLRFQWACLLF